MRCGGAPGNYPEIAGFLTRLGINSISVNPSSILRTMAVVYGAEQAIAKDNKGQQGQYSTATPTALGPISINFGGPSKFFFEQFA